MLWLAGVAGSAAVAAAGACWLRSREKKAAEPRKKKGVRIVCISDTHGRHRDIANMPDGDVLIHAGDFTHFGKVTDAKDMNKWFEELSTKYRHIIVVDGNHEANAQFKKSTGSILNHATFLRNGMAAIEMFPSELTGGVRATVKVFGTAFSWPLDPEGVHPDADPYQYLPEDVDVVVAHIPPYGYNDAAGGCRLLLKAVQRTKPTLVVSGHIHEAHGVATDSNGVTYVNASICGQHYKVGWEPVVFDL